MHPSARSFALRAAAKVAMTAAVGCGGLVDEAVGPDPAVREKVSDKTPTDAAATDVSPGIVAATSCADKSGRSAFACCIADVERAADAGVKGDSCCNVVIDFLSSEMSSPTYLDDYDLASKNYALQTCCRETKAWSQPACTPWGPPAPPAFEDEVRRAREPGGELSMGQVA